MAVEINLLEDKGYAAWDKFVRGHDAGTFCHLAGWKKVIEQGAGQDCPYLVATQDGDIVGVLPLSVKKHPIFGKALISNMFCVYGGAVTSEDTVGQLLCEEAWNLAQKNDLPVLELRSEKALMPEAAGWTDAVSSATFRTELAADDEKQLLAIPRKQRAVVRKSLKNGLQTDWDGDFDVFYDLYARSVHALGTPVFPKKLFLMLKAIFEDDVEIQITFDASGNPVASLMTFYFRDTVMPYYAGGNKSTRALAAHDHMYYELMLRARRRDCTVFDFGRSKVESGPYRFKKNWGFEPTLLEYQIKLAEGAATPNVSQQSGMFAHLSNVWKKLPVPLTKALGPSIARHLG